MPIKVSCVDCGEAFSVKDEMAGKRVRCRVCNVPIRVSSEIDAEDSQDALPVSKKKARMAAGGKKRSAAQSAAMAKILIRAGIGTAAALVIGLAIWAINGKVENNREITKQNEEINQRNAANAAADGTSVPPMPTAAMTPMPGMPTAAVAGHAATAPGHGAAAPMPGAPAITPASATVPANVLPTSAPAP